MQITLNNYQNLLTQIQKIIGQTEQKILADINHEKILMAWQVGKILEEHLLKNSRAGYGEQLFSQLEKDILIARKTLYQMRAFYKTYPTLPAKDKGLNWSHYRNLLVVKSDERRKYLEDLAVEKNLSSNQLREKISAAHKRRVKKSAPKNVKLKCERGVLNAYKIVVLEGSKKKFLDCGFNIFTEISGGWTKSWTGFATPSTSSVKSKNGTAEGNENEGGVANPVLRESVLQLVKNGKKFSLKKSELQPRQLYTYKAYLERVVDGDTIHVVLDLGFKIQHREILRLAKINAPEAETFEGAQSKKALEKILQDAPFLIVKTNKTDIYGRYIADVFLAKSAKDDPQNVAKEGEYLNQRLVDEGVAVVY